MSEKGNFDCASNDTLAHVNQRLIDKCNSVHYGSNTDCMVYYPQEQKFNSCGEDEIVGQCGRVEKDSGLTCRDDCRARTFTNDPRCQPITGSGGGCTVGGGWCAVLEHPDNPLCFGSEADIRAHLLKSCQINNSYPNCSRPTATDCVIIEPRANCDRYPGETSCWAIRATCGKLR